jgi:hypothetical protein
MRQADGGVARKQGVATDLSAGVLTVGGDPGGERRDRVADDQSDKEGTGRSRAQVAAPGRREEAQARRNDGG